MSILSRLDRNKLNALGVQLGVAQLLLDDGLELFLRVGMPYLKLASETQDKYGWHLRELVGFLKKQGLSHWGEVGLRDLQAFVAAGVTRGYSASTRNQAIWAMKKLFPFLIQQRYLTEDPAAGLIPLEQPLKEPEFLSQDAFEKLLSKVHEPRDLAIMQLHLQVGLSTSEVCRLNVSDVSLPEKWGPEIDEVGLLRLRRKREVAHLALNWKVCQALDEWLTERSAMDLDDAILTDALFISNRRNPLSPKTVQKIMAKYRKRAGLKGVTSRNLRHTMAVHYLAKGGDRRTVQDMLGLTNDKDMNRYTKAAAKVQRQMVQKLAL